jgi:pSer/pThr/pTyr-binding forkhead associated (FHA) protein
MNLELTWGKTMDDYLDLHIDIFDQPRQHAKVLRSLTIGGLIDDILKEFDLGRSNPESYVLLLRGKNTPLDPRMTIGQLDLQMHDELIFRYARVTGRLVLPDQDRAFLQEETTNSLFEIKLSPAVIGRASSDPGHNAQLAVNMKFHADSGYVSRRHAQLVVAGGQYYLESLSNNPTYVNHTDAPINGRHRLETGDQLILSQAHIRMTFFQLKAGEFDPSLPLATFKVETGILSGQIYPILNSPFTIGNEGCDINLPDDARISAHHAFVRLNSTSQKYEIIVENRTPVELPSSATIELSSVTRLHFQMA